MQLGGLDRFPCDVAVGISANLGRGFLEELLHLFVCGARFAVFQFYDVRIFHAFVDIAERQEEDVGIAAIIV